LNEVLKCCARKLSAWTIKTSYFGKFQGINSCESMMFPNF
jgi:hypothetical protein